MELSWPGGSPNLVLFGLVALDQKPLALDFLVLPLDEYLESYTPGTPWPPDPNEPPCREDVIRHLDPMATDEAVGRLLAAMDNTEFSGASAAEDYFLFAPFAQQTLSGLPAVDPPAPTSATDAEREAMVNDFLNVDGVAAAVKFEGDPDFAQVVAEFCELFIHYSEGFAGGDRYRWSPMVVADFMDYYGVNIEGDREVDELLEPVLVQWIPFCHRHKGWAQSITQECLAAVDDHLASATGEAGPVIGEKLPVPHQEQLRLLATELGTDTDDPDSMQELIETWYANESWPEEGAAPVAWARIPGEATERCREVLELLDPVLDDLMAPDHVTSGRRMVADLAVDHTDEFLRGRADVLAAGVTYAVAQVHSAFDSMGSISGVPQKLTPQQLIDAFPTVSKASITSKATKVRTLLGANGPGRARYDKIVAALTMLPYVDRDEFLKLSRGTD